MRWRRTNDGASGEDEDEDEDEDEEARRRGAREVHGIWDV